MSVDVFLSFRRSCPNKAPNPKHTTFRFGTTQLPNLATDSREIKKICEEIAMRLSVGSEELKLSS